MKELQIMPKNVSKNESSAFAFKKRKSCPTPPKNKKPSRFLRIFTFCIIIAALLTVLGMIALVVLNYALVNSVKDRVVSAEYAVNLGDIDCILVLGAGVNFDGNPSDMLFDRVSVGIRLYDGGVSERLLMSGDHGRPKYNEVGVMKNMAVDHGIAPDAVFCDYSGFSTYESIYRAKEVFCAEKVIIVSQQYHIYRALYIARKLGLEAYGVCADLRQYNSVGNAIRYSREAVARCKDIFMSQIKPLPKYVDSPYPLSGNGSITDD